MFGMIIGNMLSPYQRGVVYVFALLGAGVGALISNIIVKNLKPVMDNSDNTLDGGLTTKDFR